jgi:hypothetical protein
MNYSTFNIQPHSSRPRSFAIRSEMVNKSFDLFRRRCTAGWAREKISIPDCNAGTLSVVKRSTNLMLV